jgi:hypothetical protein
LKKAIFTLALIFCLAATLAVPAMATDPGVATITSLPDPSSTQIDVSATVFPASVTSVYFINIEWGAMRFVYDGGASVWNPLTHTYESGTGTQSWAMSDLDGVNNAIRVTNRSNHAVDAAFSFAMATPTTFNDNPFAWGSVSGGFYATNSDAATAASLGYHWGATITSLSLHTAEGREPTFGGTGFHEYSGTAYFAFSGTPDSDRALAALTRVGTITVNIAPNYEYSYNTPGSWTP